MKTKVCTKCGIDKALSEYTKITRAKDGLSFQCKLCAKKSATKHVKTCYIKIKYPIRFKFCTGCGELKNIELYHNDKSQAYGKEQKCKLCIYKNRQNQKHKLFCYIQNNTTPLFMACKECGEVNPVSEYNKYCNYPHLCRPCARAKIVINNNNKTCRIQIKAKIYFRFCKECGELKSVREYYSSKGRIGDTYSICNTCSRSKDKKQKAVCRIKITSKIYFKFCHKCGQLLPIKAFPKTSLMSNISGHGSACKECFAQYSKNNIENLAENYIRDRIHKNTGLPKNQIPEGLIELQRSGMRLKRAIKSVCS